MSNSQWVFRLEGSYKALYFDPIQIDINSLEIVDNLESKEYFNKLYKDSNGNIYTTDLPESLNDIYRSYKSYSYASILDNIRIVRTITGIQILKDITEIKFNIELPTTYKVFENYNRYSVTYTTNNIQINSTREENPIFFGSIIRPEGEAEITAEVNRIEKCLAWGDIVLKDSDLYINGKLIPLKVWYFWDKKYWPITEISISDLEKALTFYKECWGDVPELRSKFPED